MLEWMGKMQECFASYVIHCTIDSLDCSGNKIFSMHPYIKHVLQLEMYDWEMNALRDLAKDIIKENSISATDTRKVCHIYCMYMLYSSFFTTETLTIVLLCRHGHPQTATCVHPHNHVIIRCHVTVAIQGRPFSIHHANSLLYSIFISNFIALCSICT